MALGSGLGGQLTAVAEGSFGTFVSPTRGLEFQSETLDYKVNHKTSFGLAAGLIYPRDTRDVITTVGGAGDIVADVLSRGMGIYFNSLMGVSSGPTSGTNTSLAALSAVNATTVTLAASVALGDVLTIDSAGVFETRVVLANAGTTPTIAALNYPHANAAVVLVNGGTSGFVQKHTPGDTLGKSLSIQKGVPQLGGGVIPYSFTGSKVDALELSIKLDDVLNGKWTIDAQNVVTSQGLATASYTLPNNVFGYQGGHIVSDGVITAEVVDYTQKIENKSRTNLYHLNATGLKSQQIRAGEGMASGTLTVDHYTSQFVTKFFSRATATMVLCFGTTTPGEALVVTCPAIKYDDASPNLNGADIAQYPVPFSCYTPTTAYAGVSAPIQITYVNADAAL